MSFSKSAIDRFFFDDNAVLAAKAYCLSRSADLGQLIKELSFRFYTFSSLRAHLYGHTVIIDFVGDHLHAGLPAGGGDFYLANNMNGTNPYVFNDIHQVFAAILTIN